MWIDADAMLLTLFLYIFYYYFVLLFIFIGLWRDCAQWRMPAGPFALRTRSRLAQHTYQTKWSRTIFPPPPVTGASSIQQCNNVLWLLRIRVGKSFFGYCVWIGIDRWLIYSFRECEWLMEISNYRKIKQKQPRNSNKLPPINNGHGKRCFFYLIRAEKLARLSSTGKHTNRVTVRMLRVRRSFIVYYYFLKCRQLFHILWWRFRCWA